ncbi:MAG: alanine racemase [Paenibacillaceae bacterium]
MNTFHRPTWAEISLDAVEHNISEFRRVLPPDKRIMAVVKANAYGHGAIEIAEEAVRSGVDYLGVAFLDEAIQLRQAGIQAPVLVLGYTDIRSLELARQYDVTITVFSEEVLEALENSPSSSSNDMKPLNIHIKLDTGMGRIGVRGEQQSIAFIHRARSIPGVYVEGLFTHYACADETDKCFTVEQHRRFEVIVGYFASVGVEFSYLHAGNSATGIDTPDMISTMLRLGISLYGFYPSDEVNHERVGLRPVMSYKTKIIMVKILPALSTISYGATYQTQAEEKIATIPVGYGDGYTRLLTGKAYVLVRGHKVPIVGKICMDQCMINVTDIPDAAVGDEVVLFGAQGSESITADELAHTLRTINYEITCMVSYRVPRVYVRDEGQVVRVVNHLIE